MRDLEVVLLGWTIPQTAEAAGYYERTKGPLSAPSLNALVEVHYHWTLHRAFPPGESPLMTNYHEKPNTEWAAEAVINGPCALRDVKH